MQRLPLVPSPLSDEAISSWIARVAARYDASPYDLARVVLPKEAGYADMYRLIDSRVSAPLETALSAATGLPEIDFAVRRVVGLTADRRTAWPRRTPAWCLRCVIQDVVGSGEAYARREWGFGGYLICPTHNGCAHRLPAVPPATDVSAGGRPAAAMVFALLRVRGHHARVGRDPDQAATGSTRGETLQGYHVAAAGSIAASATPG